MTSSDWMEKIIRQCEMIEATIDEMKMAAITENKRIAKEEDEYAKDFAARHNKDEGEII